MQMWACFLSRESCAYSPLTSYHYFPPISSVIYTRPWVIHATEEAVDGTCQSEGAYSREWGVTIPTSVSSALTPIIMSLHEKTWTPTCDRERAHYQEPTPKDVNNHMRMYVSSCGSVLTEQSADCIRLKRALHRLLHLPPSYLWLFL